MQNDLWQLMRIPGFWIDGDETNSLVRWEMSKLIRKLEDAFIKPKEIKILRWTGAVSSLDAALLLDLSISPMAPTLEETDYQLGKFADKRKQSLKLEMR